MAGISNEERRRRAVQKAREMLIEHAPRTVELLFAAINKDPDEGFEDLPAQSRANLIMKALEYQVGKSTPKSKVVEEDEEVATPEEDQPGLQIA